MFFMFFKNVITKSLFLFFLGSFIGLSAMDTPSIQSVFGHRLRLKNFTPNRLFVEVEKTSGEQWRALVDTYQSIDLGSINDDFNQITIIKHQTNLMYDSEIAIPVDRIDQIKRSQFIPENNTLYCIVTSQDDVYSCKFECTNCEKNKFQALPSNPSDHSYLDVLGLYEVFSQEDVIARADRLFQEWNPEFYTQDKEYDQIKRVQEYIKLAKSFLLHALQVSTQEEASTSSVASTSTQTEELTGIMERLTLSIPYSQAPQPAPSTCPPAPSPYPEEVESQKPLQQTIDESYFRQLLERVRENVSVYTEQRKPNPANNTMLLSVFRLKQPIIPFEELFELINRCIKTFDDQIRINVDDKTSYVQKQFIDSDSIINITGDIHGSIHSLIRIIDDALQNINAKTKFVFLGDYTDRGLFGTEVLALLMCLKIIRWDSVFLIRGNHESYEMNSDGGWAAIQNNEAAFKTELEAKYGLEAGNKLLLHFNELYKRLPLAVYLGTNKDTMAQFCHGGLQPGFNPQEFLSGPKSIQGLRFGGNFSSYFNGFVWGDFYLKNNQVIQDVSLRGDDLDFIQNISNVMTSNPEEQSPECTGIKAIFRGHQHIGCGLKMFPRDVDESLKKYDTEVGLMPIPWYQVMGRERIRFEDSWVGENVRGQDGAEYTKWKIRICRFTPIYTFSTATEHGMAEETFYGILHTAENFNDWMLEPIAIINEITE